MIRAGKYERAEPSAHVPLAYSVIMGIKIDGRIFTRPEAPLFLVNPIPSAPFKRRIRPRFPLF